MVNKNLIEAGLKSCDTEKLVQKRIINAVNDKEYTLAEVLVRLYDRVCDSTDKIARNVILDTTDEDLDTLNDEIDEVARKLYGENNSLGLSFSTIVSNTMTDAAVNNQVVEEDTFNEELYYYIHRIAIDKYLKAEEGLYKEEMLDHINNNISISHSLRALFRGDRERFDKYNPDLYFEPLEQIVCGENFAQVQVLSLCIVLEELNECGKDFYLKTGFSKKDTARIIEAQRDMNEIKLAGLYVQAKKRGFDLSLDYSGFSEKTIDCIKKGFTIGEEYLKEFPLEKSNQKNKHL